MLPELEAVQGLLKYVHHQAKDQLKGLDEEGLNWTPAGVAEVNSIFGLTVHVATSQVAMCAAAVGVDVKLDVPELEAEHNGLKAVGTSAERAIELLRLAAEKTNEMFEQITAETLDREIGMPGGGKRPARYLIQVLLSHASEHVGHMSLTKQLYLHQKQK
jgi:DinB superfamily